MINKEIPIKFSIQPLSKQSINADEESLDCLIMGVYENGELTASAQKFDMLSNQFISGELTYGNFKGKLGAVLLLTNILIDGSRKRILLVGVGEAKKLNEKNYQQIVKSAFQALVNTRYQKVGFYLTELPLPMRNSAWMTREAILRYVEVTYKFEDYKSVNSDPSSLEAITFFAATHQDMESMQEAVREGIAIANGIQLTKNLGNMPCNDCTPTYLAQTAEKLAGQYSSIKTKLYNQKKLIDMKFGAFTAVGQGSAESSQLIILEYHGADKQTTPFALVGKGITFDTGGLSLKAATSMLEMKFDMCGAATVLGVMRAIAELKLPINVIGALAAAENMPDGNAYKPESIIKTLSGQTVEISNTDAEGRLVLCDTLTYIEQEYKPQTIIDIATLTGAVVIALGRVMAGLFTKDEELARELKLAATQTFEPLWQLPLGDDYAELLESSTADMMNASIVREGGASVAASFLAKFVKNTPWAHIDIAGIANTNGTKKSATGRTVALLVQYLQNASKA